MYSECVELDLHRGNCYYYISYKSPICRSPHSHSPTRATCTSTARMERVLQATPERTWCAWCLQI